MGSQTQESMKKFIASAAIEPLVVDPPRFASAIQQLFCQSRHPFLPVVSSILQFEYCVFYDRGRPVEMPPGVSACT